MSQNANPQFRYTARTADGRACCSGNEPNFPRCQHCRSQPIVVRGGVPDGYAAAATRHAVRPEGTAPARTPYSEAPNGYAAALERTAAARGTSPTTTATTPTPGMPPDGYAVALAAMRQQKEQ